MRTFVPPHFQEQQLDTCPGIAGRYFADDKKSWTESAGGYESYDSNVFHNKQARRPLAAEHQLSNCRHALGKHSAGLSEQAASDKNATGLLPDSVPVSLHGYVSKHKGTVVGSRA